LEVIDDVLNSANQMSFCYCSIL